MSAVQDRRRLSNSALLAGTQNPPMGGMRGSPASASVSFSPSGRVNNCNNCSKGPLGFVTTAATCVDSLSWPPDGSTTVGSG